MSLDACHPQYHEFQDSWRIMEDCYAGPRRIKALGPVYLPPTRGMIRDGALLSNLRNRFTGDGYGVTYVNDWYFLRRGSGVPDGETRYWDYLKRAVFYNYVREAVKIGIGVMHHKPPTIELPNAMQDMVKSASVRGESMAMLLRRINVQQLVLGRLGLFLDLPKETQERGRERPYIVLYRAPQIINWDDGESEELTLPKLNLVVLDESAAQRTGDFEWETVEQHRVLVMGNLEVNEPRARYKAGVFTKEEGFRPDGLKPPVVRGKPLDEIPFVICNACDHESAPEEPPLMGLAEVALAIYRGDADYRQTLHEQANATLVVIGGAGDPEKPQALGAGAKIDVLTGGDAKYISAPAEGIEGQRQALVDDKMLAAEQAGQLIDSRSGQKEGAETLRIRVAAQTATLNEIALTGAAALKKLLQTAAVWLGADPEEVIVEPNLDFDGARMTGQELVQLMTAKGLGAPLSKRSIHAQMRQGELTQLEFEEEESELEGEVDLPAGGGLPDDDPDQSMPKDPDDDDPEE